MSKDEQGLSLLEVVTTTAGVVVLAASVGYFTYQHTTEKSYQEGLHAASAVAYTEALDIMTGFEHIDAEEIDEAITAQLTSMSTDEYTLGYEGTDASSLCVFATSPEWDTDDYIAANGACGDEEELVRIVDENVEDVRTTLVYRCDVDSMVTPPWVTEKSPIRAVQDLGKGNTKDMPADWSMSNKYPMAAGKEYTIHIYGKYDVLRSGLPVVDPGCLREIQHIGEDTEVEGLHYLGTQVESVPKSIPASVTTTSAAFHSNSNFNDPNVRHWDVSNVKSIANMFVDATSFNQDISHWDTSNVDSMQFMFSGASSFNQPIGAWDVSNVLSMRSVFHGAESFNQPLHDWETGNVNDMQWMFRNAYDFNQDVSMWDVSNVANMSYMFSMNKESQFNNGGQPLDWEDTSAVEDMSFMFFGTEKFNQDVSSWKTGNVTNMSHMFYNARNFNQPLNSWNTSNLTTMRSMFYRAYDFNQPLDQWNTSNVKDMHDTFAYATSFDQDISSWNLSKVTNMSSMFMGSYSQPTRFNNGGHPLNWDTSNVTNMRDMFRYAKSLNQDLSGWNVSNVTSSSGFSIQSGLADQPEKLPNFP